MTTLKRVVQSLSFELVASFSSETVTAQRPQPALFPVTASVLLMVWESIRSLTQSEQWALPFYSYSSIDFLSNVTFFFIVDNCHTYMLMV